MAKKVNVAKTLKRAKIYAPKMGLSTKKLTVSGSPSARTKKASGIFGRTSFDNIAAYSNSASKSPRKAKRAKSTGKAKKVTTKKGYGFLGS